MSTRPRTADETLAALFPQRHRTATCLTDGLREARQLPLTPPDRSFFGVVAEIAIGLHLAIRPPYLGHLACVKPELAQRILVLSGYTPAPDHTESDLASWHRAPGPQHPGCLYTAASRLANIAMLRRALGLRRTDVNDAASYFIERYPRVLVNHRGDIWHGRPAFRTFWGSFSHTVAPILRSLGPASAQVPLHRGGRYADLQLGPMILEVKTGLLGDPAILLTAVDQLLTYGILAHHDGRQVTELALYAARYERLLRFDIHDFLYGAAGRQVDLTTAGALLAAAIDAEERPR